VLVNVVDATLPEQIVCIEGVAVITGTGLTVTVTGVGAPWHPFAAGVTVYTAVPGTTSVAVNVCAIDDPAPSEAPDTPVWLVTQEKVFPETVPFNVILVVLPEQRLGEGGVDVTIGIGFTTTGKLIGAPAHVFTEGVIV